MMLVPAGPDPLREQFPGQRSLPCLPRLKPFEEALGDGVSVGVMDKSRYCYWISLERILQYLGIAGCVRVEMSQKLEYAHGLPSEMLGEALVDESLAASRVDEQASGVQKAGDQDVPVWKRGPGMNTVLVDPPQHGLTEGCPARNGCLGKMSDQLRQMAAQEVQ